jgi:glyoxylase-like metal-dependent hydrolase (beta-lactamase superfamily II)
VAVVCTHAHDDHVNQAPALSDRFDAPVYLHPAEAPLWAMAHPDRKPDHDLCDGDVLTAGWDRAAGDHDARALPGLVVPLRPGAGDGVHGRHPVPGRSGRDGRSFSSFDTIIDSIRTRLLTLPADTTVRTGHGDSTSIGAEAPNLEEWIVRGH